MKDITKVLSKYKYINRERIGLPFRCMPRAIDVFVSTRQDTTPQIRFVDIWLSADKEFKYGTVMRIHTNSGKVETVVLRDDEGDQRVINRKASFH